MWKATRIKLHLNWEGNVMTSKHQIDTDEILAMCKRLSYKYPQHDMREDLRSEAMLSIYERLSVKPDEHPAYLYNLAREAMSDYVNLRNRTVVVPANKTTRAIAANRAVPRLTNYSNEGIIAVYDALQPTKEFDPDKSGHTVDCTEMYETKDFISKALKSLTEREADLIDKRYLKEMSQEDLATMYEVSQKTICSWEAKALKKMSKL